MAQWTSTQDCFEQHPYQAPAFKAADAANARRVVLSADSAQESVRTWIEQQVRRPRGRAAYDVRLFTAATASRVWKLLRSRRAGNRHLYELIREGTPCHLYFDLEVDLEPARFNEAEAALDTLLSILTELFRYGPPVTAIVRSTAWQVMVRQAAPLRLS